jgi:hypothetical protein
MPKLNKLDISENLLAKECFAIAYDFKQTSVLVKLKANYTNFDLGFFGKSTGVMHELQLNGCKGIRVSNLMDFFSSTSEHSTSVFDVFKLL